MTAPGEVLLVCMPFGAVFSPSIGLSLLKAELAAQGIPSRVLYFSIAFAELVGQDFYHRLAAEGRPPISSLAGEWIFSGALFGPRPGDETYVDEVLRERPSGIPHDRQEPLSPALVRRILRARQEADRFLDACRDEIVLARPALVGFSSMFQQHVASLALARRVKQALPGTFVVFGGANCRDVMGAETVRRFPFVDAAVSGEADLVFHEIVRRVQERRSVADLPGVRTGDGLAAEPAAGRLGNAPAVPDLDALPYPDYGDYFEQFASSRYGPAWRPSLPMETSRGCWWGERSQCAFCGLDPQAIAFRRKSAGRALDELAWLTRCHPGCSIEATDCVLDLRAFEDFVPRLLSRRRRVALFYEVKANLRKEQLRQLRDAGVRSLQPGIESLSDPVLRLMRKGTSALQNIQLLKWCRELGIDPAWNLLWGFPGEPPGEYERMADLVPRLSHLPPPRSAGAIRLDRFSPNFADAERLGLVNVRPVPAYRHVYALPDEAVARLASFFTCDDREPRDVLGYVTRLEKRLRAWPRLFGASALFSVDRNGWLLVWDLRPGSRAPLTALRGVDRLLYEACDSARTARGLAESLASVPGGPLAAEDVARRLEPLVERGLMVRDASRYLALAVPLGRYSPPPRAVARFHDLTRALGRRRPGGWVVPLDVAGRPLGRRPCSVGGRSRRGRAPVRPELRLAASQFSVSARGEVRVRLSAR